MMACLTLAPDVVSFQLHAAVALPPREAALGTNGTGGWVSHRTRVDILQPSRSFISCSRSSHCTNWATPAAGAVYALHKTFVLWTTVYIYTCIYWRWRSVFQWRIATV